MTIQVIISVDDDGQITTHQEGGEPLDPVNLIGLLEFVKLGIYQSTSSEHATYEKPNAEA